MKKLLFATAGTFALAAAGAWAQYEAEPEETTETVDIEAEADVDVGETEVEVEAAGETDQTEADVTARVETASFKPAFTPAEAEHLLGLVEVTARPVVQIGDVAILSASALTADTLIGSDVHNDSGDKIGSVRDVVLTPQGDVKSLVVASGGFLGLNTREAEVDIGRVRLAPDDRAETDDPAEKKIVVSMTQEELRQLPEIERDTAAAGEIFATDLLDEEVEFTEPVEAADVDGYLRDIIIDQSGQARFAVVGHGGILETGVDEAYALVAFRDVEIAQGGEGVVLDLAAPELADVMFAYSVDEAQDRGAREKAAELRMKNNKKKAKKR
jgi:sporulation protein YlmC with PRC-barrel domain